MNSKLKTQNSKLSEDLHFLRRTLALAKRAQGRTSPNPMVGAIVVKNGVVVGEGFHPKAGQPHAETFALRAAGKEAAGATLYVSLEPCAHHGKTPPCADSIVCSGIRRVVFASLDVDPRCACRGLAILQDAGIEVDYGALTDEEQRLNEAYRHWKQTGLPFVTLKMAASLDGKIATFEGDSKWITGKAARRDVHRLRNVQDAILTTAKTVAADNPALTARIPGGHDPRRVVVDARACTSPDALVYAPAERPPILATTVDDEALLAPFRERGVEVLTLPVADGHVDLQALMKALGEREILSLLIEAGGEFAAALLAEKLVQKIRWYAAPLLIGGNGIPALGFPGISLLAEAPRLQNVSCKKIGDDIRIEGYPEY